MSFRWRPRTLDQQFADQEERLRQVLAPTVPVTVPADPWEGADFAPSWRADAVAPVIGDGYLAGHLIVVGRALFVRIVMAAGASTTFGTGSWYFDLPAGMTARAFAAGSMVLDGRAVVGGDVLVAQGQVDVATPRRIYVVSQSTGTTSMASVDDAWPAAWAAGDSLELHGLVDLA